MSSKTARSNIKTVVEANLPKAKRGPKPKLVVEFPEPLASDWIDVPTFSEALALHVARHGETICHLHRSLACQGDEIARSTLLQWAAGKKAPSSVASMIILGRVERRYRLPSGYFRAKLFNNVRAPTGHKGLKGVSPSERRRLAWHLPDDFDRRSAKEREEILDWVRSVVISGSTEYRRYQAEAVKHRFGIRFPDLTDRRPIGELDLEDDEDIQFLADVEMDLTAAAVDAPPRLADEMADLIRFKTATLTEIGFQRNGVWNSVTGAQKIEHLGLLFGALAASPRSEIKGFGVPHKSLAFGMLVFPAVWDWYVQWRERRRGFYRSRPSRWCNFGCGRGPSSGGFGGDV